MDYIFAGGKRIARVGVGYMRLHTSGTFTGSNKLRWNFPKPTNADGTPYTIAKGDSLCWQQYNTGGGVGGPAVFFSDGSSTAWNLQDTGGSLINQWGGEKAWIVRSQPRGSAGSR